MMWLKKFVGFRVLEHFLTRPSEEIHLKELARVLKISPASTKTYCDALLEDGLILEEAKGNLRLFRLNRDDFAAREIMKAYYLLKLKNLGIENLTEGSTSLVVYGSFARGNFNEWSDLDLLVIGEESNVNKDRVLDLQEALEREIQLTVVPYYKWETMKKEGDSFSNSVLKDHIVIKGVEL